MVGQTLNDKTLSLIMKGFSILSGLGIALLGVMDFVYFTSRIRNPIDFMLAIYFVIFGIVAIICEFPIRKFAFYFSFLKGYFGKGIYFIFIATISMDVSVWWRILIFIFVCLTGIIYIVLSCSARNKLVDEDEEAAPQNEKAPAENNKA